MYEDPKLKRKERKEAVLRVMGVLIYPSGPHG
jgi:hypothetical protein